MSLIPMGGNKPSPNPWLAENYPASLLTMGLTAERVARHYGISRDDQDDFALCQPPESSRRASRRPLRRRTRFPSPSPPPLPTKEWQAHTPRKRTSPPTKARAPTPPPTALAQLKPVFHAQGTVTAGNSSQTSDGAAAAVLMEAGRARELGLRPLARLVSYAVTGCLPEEMGIGPITAIPKALALAGLTLNDIELIELNEAFAAQVLAIIRALGLDPARVNVNGGAIALGHPLGCTGAKLTATLLREMKAPERALRHGHHVRRRRHGRCRHLRAALSELAARYLLIPDP